MDDKRINRKIFFIKLLWFFGIYPKQDKRMIKTYNNLLNKKQ